ncbi:cation:proton antiporter [Kiritimatiellota bacterium B12222]|nr:cation:proton antiporter [Kiritimatiellota bacterium B12222]
MITHIAFLSLFIFFYLLVSARMEKTMLSGSLLFVLVGWLVGPYGLQWLSFPVKGEGLSLLAELTLAVVLFGDAARARLRILQKSWRYPERLLLLGLPMTVILGWGIAMLLFPGFSMIDAAILATILAPTDAALGKAVMTRKEVPAPIAESLNVESGLNDGICVPVMVVLLSLSMDLGSVTMGSIVITLLEKVGIGILVGVVIALIGEKWVKFCVQKEWSDPQASSLAMLSLAFACYSVAESLEGSGFIAAFMGGLIFGALCKHEKFHGFLSSEANGDGLSQITWVIFGGTVVGQCASFISWQVGLYALLSLTLIRMLPVWISLLGTDLNGTDKLFMGWFGPRGLASVVFVVMVFHHQLDHAGGIATVAMTTIMLSVLLHGLTANPLVKRCFGSALK